MGKILDIYFRFAAGGDYYLGQLLTLKDPSKAEFNVACPHWKDPDHPTIRHAINQSFGSVILSHEFTDHDPHAVLSLLLASMVHHSGWILHVCDKYPTHPFHQLPLINDLELLADLKENHLTLELNVHVPEITGIPPHVDQLVQAKKNNELLRRVEKKIDQFNSNLGTHLKRCWDEQVRAEGQVNSTIMYEALGKMEERIMA